MIHLFTCSALLDQGLSGQPMHIPGGDCSIGLPTPLHFATQSPCWTVDKTLSVSPPGTRVPTAHGEHGEQGALVQSTCLLRQATVLFQCTHYSERCLGLAHLMGGLVSHFRAYRTPLESPPLQAAADPPRGCGFCMQECFFFLFSFCTSSRGSLKTNSSPTFLSQPTFFGDALVEYLCRVLTGRSTSSSPGVSNIHKYTVPLVGIFGLRSAPAEGPPV